MPVPRLERPCCSFFVVLVTAVCFLAQAGAEGHGSALSANLLSSNAIKNQQPSASSAGASASAAPALYDGSNKHQAADPHQSYTCLEDEDCRAGEFCSAPAREGGNPGVQVCLACRRRRKRCHRHAMCCPGTYCKNGICMLVEDEHFHPKEVEETIVESAGHGTVDPHSRRTTTSNRFHHTKGPEGALCLRSSDCAEGLCCARHFWSKICKPVLKEGQVCTKHRKKGTHGLEIFQRCNCGEGLACRIQRDHTISNSPRLHTCQRH
uniref:Dickkopf WNT signaling pathway inhibitor 1 n=1 Tax=Salvator merianae TaxID=96440 RepID=A0A8D0C9X2_SALMN